MGSETVAASLNWDNLQKEGSNNESREMLVETVDSHILLSPVQVLNQTCFGGREGEDPGSSSLVGDPVLRVTSLVFNVFNAINRFESKMDSISISPRVLASDAANC